MKPAAAAPVATVDAQNPWLGLVSFTEETRSYFHGREEEGAELGRRVQRKLLTVLFGQSGLGKTSILQAGLVPRLRPEGFCPVYVRLDYDPHSPPPAEQIKRAVFRATAAAGFWTQSGSAVSGETLWEFLHHRDDVLKDAAGRTLIPILIFDQFEEIFTLAQSDDAGRQRAQEFLTDLADLVENRPPAALEARIDRDEADAAKFDFARADYRILISLREDYLAHLEGLKARMPSVTQNRMRLARMTGAQAIAAVREPAPHLVSEAVAAAIVRFVAGGAELAGAEVEPSLLSLICRELNNTRLAQGQPEISADLLAGSRDTIFTQFYERALTDQPPGVRVFIEDEMLTDSGFRESLAEERVRKGFAAAGASPEAVAKLVDRRLLRVEDRLDMRRVEITHDVLCSVVGASRQVRREREALEASRRELAAQQEREAATQRALQRARLVAAVASGLMLVAAASAVFGWINFRRARAAEAQTQVTQHLVEQARAESEKLIGFLLEDFYEELMPTGRGEIVGKLAEKAVAYYDGLPAELMTPQTKVYRGMALVRKASSLSAAGKVAAAAEVSHQAQKIFEELRAAGDRSDELTTALALAIFARNNSAGPSDNSTELKMAADLLRPLVASGRASRGAKLALGDNLQFLAHQQEPKDGLVTCEESRKILADMGALDLSDLTAASIYGDVTDSQSRMAQELGRTDEAERLAGIVHQLAEKVLEQRPGDLRAMKNHYFSLDMMGTVALDRHDLAKAEANFLQAEEAARNYVQFNPADSWGWRILGVSGDNLMQIYADQGRISDALRKAHQTTDLEHDPRNKTATESGVQGAWRIIQVLEAQRGNIRTARSALTELRRVQGVAAKERNFDPELAQLSGLLGEMAEFDLLAAEGDYAAIHARAIDISDRIQKIKEHNGGNRTIRTEVVRRSNSWRIESGLRLGNYEEAVTGAREFIDNPQLGRLDQQGLDIVQARGKVRLGQALLGAGRRTEALGPLGEAEAYYRGQRAKGAGEVGFLIDFGRALYHLARAQADDVDGLARRRSLLAEAAGVLDGISPEAQQLQGCRELMGWIADARAQAGG